MKRICIGLFGFIRNPINYAVFKRFRSLLPDECIIDIIITCPNKINEYDHDTDTIDENSEIMEDIRVAFGDCNVYIDVFEYNPLIFVKRVKELGLPDYTSFPSYRVLSQHFSISSLSNNICYHVQDNNIQYDSIILTRFDIIPGVRSLGQLLEQVRENTIHNLRRCPYASDLHSEDRIIISSMNGVRALCGLYECAKDRVPDIYEDLVPEIIIGKYIRSYDNLSVLPQEGIILEHSPSKEVKYTDNAKNYLEQLLDKYHSLLPIQMIHQ